MVVPLFHNRNGDVDFRTASRAYRATGHFGDDVMAGIYNEQLVTCRRFMDDDHHGIDFRFWTGSVMWEPVWRAVMFVARQPWVAEAYVGVTACCRWRWADCWKKEAMRPHNERFDKMYAICASRGGNIAGLEHCLHAKLLDTCPRICAHGQSYKRGPVSDRGAMILYVCIKHNPGRFLLHQQILVPLYTYAVYISTSRCRSAYVASTCPSATLASPYMGDVRSQCGEFCHWRLPEICGSDLAAAFSRKTPTRNPRCAYCI